MHIPKRRDKEFVVAINDPNILQNPGVGRFIDSYNSATRDSNSHIRLGRCAGHIDNRYIGYY
ncbi:MAG: hypothetical protein ABL999_06500 [Pyrinomonadaceae bacterium]